MSHVSHRHGPCRSASRSARTKLGANAAIVSNMGPQPLLMWRIERIVTDSDHQLREGEHSLLMRAECDRYDLGFEGDGLSRTNFLPLHPPLGLRACPVSVNRPLLSSQPPQPRHGSTATGRSCVCVSRAILLLQEGGVLCLSVSQPCDCSTLLLLLLPHGRHASTQYSHTLQHACKSQR